MDAEVLVVGAGPVGLMAASELRRRAVPVRIIDALPGPARITKALGTQGRTLEIYEQLGFVEEILARGQRATAFVRHMEGQPALRYDFGYSEVPTRYEFSLQVDQSITESVLRAHLGRLGTEVEWNTKLTSVTQDPEGVHCVITAADGTESTVDTPWLIGCDGAHSVVRKELGIPLAGESSYTWLVADARADIALDREAVHWLYADGGAAMLFPLREQGRWRMVDTADASQADDPAAVADRFRRRIGAASGNPITVHALDWISAFTIQQRSVPVMQSGRCFVAGDAAHVHSPAGGQGMNTGLQDAFNLGWKLAEVINGHAERRLLDSYSAERVPIGKALLDSTAMITDYVMNGSTGLTDSAQLANAGREIIGRVQAVSINYAESEVTQRSAGTAEPQPGSRITRVNAEGARGKGWRRLLDQLHDPRWVLLSVNMPELAVRADWLVALAIEDGALATDLGAPDGGWFLIRPDGYLSARGTASDPVRVPLAYAAAGNPVRP